MMPKFSEQINALINKGKYDEAREWIRAGLKWLPKDHWLLDRMSLTYFEERRYVDALHWSEKAYKNAKSCPMVLWGYANAMEEVGRYENALSLYNKILDKGTAAVAHGECGEGSDGAESLLADSAYRAALCYQNLNRLQEAFESILTHFSMLEQGAKSIYPEPEVRQVLKSLSQFVGTTSSGNEPSGLAVTSSRWSRVIQT
jgi:hypothetical protein